jgi:hypothetical protein
MLLNQNDRIEKFTMSGVTFSEFYDEGVTFSELYDGLGP